MPVEYPAEAEDPRSDSTGLRQIDDVFWLSTPDRRRVLYVSPGYESVWGRPPGSAFAGPASLRAAVHPEDRLHVEWGLRQRGGHELEYRIVRPDGDVRWIRERSFAIPDARGEVQHLASFARDVTTERKILATIAASERRYRALFEHASDLISVFDRDRKRLYANRAARRVLGFDEEDVACRPLLDRVHPHDLPRMEKALSAALDRPGEPSRVEFRQRRDDGSYGIFEGMIVSLLDVAGVDAVVKCMRDVTATRFLDPLTGLPNESSLVHHLDLLTKTGGPARYSFVMVDLDRFSSIIASIGASDGDEVLIGVARRLEPLANHPSLIARLHGDRFGLILDGVTSPSEALAVVDRLRGRFDAPFPSRVGPLQVSASFGLLVAPSAAAGALDVIRSAEMALEAAKRAGRGRSEIFDESMRHRMLERLELESALRRAISSDELVVHYQPIFHLCTGRLAGFEALVRWEHPKAGLMPPDSFIPLAEETGLVRDLDLAVIRRAAEQLVKWRLRYPGLASLDMSVNLSARHFDGDGLVDQLDRILAETGVPPSALKLEITESILLSQPELAAKTMRALQERGMRFLLDDFGTGYSSLGYLHRFPFDGLKIDRSFVMSLGSNGESPALVRAIIGMARTLGMRVIAEGIESQAQVDFLREARCELGQGYAFARPMSAAAAEALLAPGTAE